MVEIRNFFNSIFSKLSDIFFNNPDFWDNFTWWSQIIGGLGTFLTIVITVIIFWHGLNKDKDEKRKKDEFNSLRRCYPLINEIGLNNKDLNDEKAIRIIDSSKQINYITTVLNTNIHDSMSYSGLLNDFDYRVQQLLATLYFRINIRNELIRYKIDLDVAYEMMLKSSENKSYYCRKKLIVNTILLVVK